MSSNLHHRFSHVDVFSLLEIDEAPSGPGLYAWYNIFAPGPPSWKPQREGKHDRTPPVFRQLLQRYTGRFSTHVLDVTATGPFNTRWSGSLANTSDNRWQQLIANVEEPSEQEGDAQPLPFLQATIEHPKAREVLVKTLEAATPIFSSPLYIGVATSLRKRLRQHSLQLYRLQEAQHSLQLDGDELSTDEATFAKRVIERGFMLDDLRVYTLALDDLVSTELTPTQLRSVAESAEWLLNRWHKPLLGRR